MRCRSTALVGLKLLSSKILLYFIERDRIYGDLDELQGDINVKERLIAELETNKRKLEKTQQDYERKLAELGERIQHTEAERDKILSQMAAKKPEKQQEKEEIRKVCNFS